MKDKLLPVSDHIRELRNRLLVIAIAIIISSFACYGQIKLIVDYLVAPAGEIQFVYLSPPELFTAYIKLSLVCGLLVASPLILYNIFSFVKPGLNTKEKKYLLLALIFGTVFFSIGALFAYMIIIPLTLDFFLRIRLEGIEPLFSFPSYVGFCGTLIFSFGTVFQMPIIIIILTGVSILTPSTLRRYRKFFVLGIFIMAAIITPPDVVSQVLLALPMIVLYEISILLSTLMFRKNRKINA